MRKKLKEFLSKAKKKPKLKQFFSKMSKKQKIFTAIIVVIVVAVGIKMIIGKPNQSAMILQAEATVTKDNIEESMSKTGTIESTVFKIIKPTKSGTVENVFVEDGGNILKGEKLLRINYDEKDGNLGDSNYNILQQKKEIENLKEDNEKYQIKAPESGVLLEFDKKKGDNVKSGEKIGRIIDKNIMIAAVKFAKDTSKKISVGDKAEIFLPEYLTQLDGVVTKVSQVGYGLNEGAIVHDVEVEFPNPGALKEGTKVNASIINGSGKLLGIDITTAKFKTDKEIISEVEGDILQVYYQSSQKVNKDATILKISDKDHQDKINMESRKLNNLQENYEEDKKRFDDHIYAPVSGTVVDLNVVSGENITGETTIATIVDLENFQMTIPVDEKYILKVKEGQDAVVTVDAVEGVSYDGTIKKVFQIGKNEGGNTTYNVIISLNNDENLKNLKIGMNAKVKVVLDSKEEVLLVPTDYVKAMGDDYILKVKQGDGSIKEVAVTLGLATSDFVEVEGNIKEGDTIINEFGY